MTMVSLVLSHFNMCAFQSFENCRLAARRGTRIPTGYLAGGEHGTSFLSLCLGRNLVLSAQASFLLGARRVRGRASAGRRCSRRRAPVGSLTGKTWYVVLSYSSFFLPRSPPYPSRAGLISFLLAFDRLLSCCSRPTIFPLQPDLHLQEILRQATACTYVACWSRFFGHGRMRGSLSAVN